MITHLTANGVSILNTVDGENCRKAYINNETGRRALRSEQPGEIVSEIMKVWGQDISGQAADASAEDYREKYNDLKKKYDSLKEKHEKLIGYIRGLDK